MNWKLARKNFQSNILHNFVQINLACKQSIQKVTEMNIEKQVSSLTFTMATSKQFLKETDISIKNYGKHTTYNQEIRKIVNYFNKYIGKAWNMVKRQKQQVKWRNVILEPNQLPWNRIKKAINEFDKYFEQSSQFFKIDHSFTRE